MIFSRSYSADDASLTRRCPTQKLALTVEVPLIITQEWRKTSSLLHIEDKTYRKKGLLAMSALAVRKAKQVNAG